MEQGGGDGQKASVKTIITRAFEGHMPPMELSVAIVSLVELAQLAMPDAAKVRQAILGAGFAAHAEDSARMAGEIYAFDNRMVGEPVTGLKHEFFERDRHGAPVFFLLSVGRTATRSAVFLSTLFTGASEGDAVKAVAHVSKADPLTGSTVVNARGQTLRRVFWDVEGVAGVRFIVTSGPPNVDDTAFPRAITAISLV